MDRPQRRHSMAKLLFAAYNTGDAEEFPHPCFFHEGDGTIGPRKDAEHLLTQMDWAFWSSKLRCVTPCSMKKARHRH